MKKLFRYFPNRKIAIILILFIMITLTMKQGYCLNYTDVGTQAFNEELEKKLEKGFEFDNYLYQFFSNTPNNNTGMAICFFINGIQYERVPNQTNITYYRESTQSWNGLKCIRTSISNLNNEVSINNISSINGTVFGNNNGNWYPVYSSIQLTSDGTENGTVTVEKNIDYKKPTCPVCEECTECPSGGEEEECGPVEITNFPIDKNEFYVLLLILSTLIFMLFFKWCFPMKGGKK